MKAGFSIKLILYFAPNCPQQIVAPNCPTPNCPRRIVLRRIVRTPSALYLMLGITDQVGLQFQLLFERRKGFGFPNSCRKTVPGTWTSDLKGPIAHFSLGSWHENIRRV